MSGARDDSALFRHAPDPAMPGWWTWDLADDTRFNALLGPLHVRADPDGRGRLRMVPQHVHSNLGGGVHGGVTLAFVDIALFATCKVLGLFEPGLASTVDCSVQFLSPGRMGEPLDAVSEVLRETGRLVFLRGLVVQGEGDGHRVAAYSATVRKPPRG